MDALVDGILAEVSARGSDPSLLRILRLRVVAAAMLGKRKVLLNVGAEYATVRDCTARVLKDLRPLAFVDPKVQNSSLSYCVSDPCPHPYPNLNRAREGGYV